MQSNPGLASLIDRTIGTDWQVDFDQIKQLEEYAMDSAFLEDLIAVISLYRPGPADSIDTYIHNRHHPEDTEYKSELLKDILDVTYGCMVYQEQVMEIVRKMGGYSLGRADLVRRAMSKKKEVQKVGKR